MSNRVDYLSDKLVNLRGKLKHVDQVMPPDSIANGVTVTPPAAAERKQRAEDRRRDDTMHLANDYMQRLVKRTAQVKMQQNILQNELQMLNNMEKELESLRNSLQSLQIKDNEELSSVQTGERFRAIDRERLSFYELDGRIELLLNQRSCSESSENIVQHDSDEKFSTLIKRGWALALTVGIVTGLFVIAAALIIYQAWR